MGALYQQHRIERVLVVAPTSVCSVWPHDLQQFAAFPYHCETLLGEKKKRLEGLDALEVWPFASLKIAVINYESTHRDGIFDALAEYDADLIICDESQRIKNHSAAQSKALHKLGDKARYKLALSGTPVQNNAVDLYSQYRFLDPAVFGSNFFAFRNRYCVMGGYGQHQIIGYKHMEQLIQKEHSIAYRVTKAECLDLPPQTFENRYVKFTPAERKLYDQLRKSSFAELAGGDSITATTVLTKMLRLMQLTGGFTQTDDGTRPQQIGTAKLDALEDILDDYVLEAGQKLVIFARFRPEIAAIENLLRKKGIKYGSIYGDVPQAERGGIVDDFQQNPETKVFVAQIQTAGLGITLHAASAAVFYSLDFNMGIVLFNHDRNRVIGKVTRAWVEDNRGKATIEFDNDEDSETVRSKVASGTLKGVSVGYRVSNYESVKEGAKSLDGRFTGPCYIAKKWQPYEISIVSVPADTTVGVGRDMTEDGQPPAVQTAPGLAFYESQLAANRNY